MANNETLGASFSIDITALKAGLTQANRLIRESESEFREAAAGMDDWTKSQEGLEARQKTLNKQIDLQQDKVAGLVTEKNRIVEAMKKEGKSTDEIAKATDEVNKLITRESKELDKLRKELDKAETASEKLSNETEELGDKAEEAGDGFTVAKGALSNFIADGLSNFVGACKDAIGTLLGLSESTREYREDIGKLNTAFETAGLSQELATKTYKDLFAVLGEEDRTVEAVNHLAKFIKTEEDMATWTNTLTGIWGAFGDSLPIEGLTEATNESIKNGQVTGVLADALNWAAQEGEDFGLKLKKSVEFTKLSKKELEKLTEKQLAEYKAREAQANAVYEWNKKINEATTAEEKFNIALEQCTTEQERQELITSTLNGLYSESANNYKKNNKTIMEANKATSDYTDKVAELGAKVEPITVTVQKGWNRLLDTALDLVNDVDFDKLGRKVEKGFEKLAEDIIPKVVDGFEWIVDNWKGIQAGLLGAFAVFTTYKIVTAVGKATTAFKVFFATIKAGTLTNPIGLIATGVALLVGGIVTLTASTEKYTKAQQAEIDAAKDSADVMRDKAEAYRESKQAIEEETLAELNELGNIERLNNELKTLVDEKGKVAEKDEARVQFIMNELNTALGTEYSLTDGIVKNYQQMQKEIDLLIEKEKAQILLEGERAKYEEAILNKNQAEQDLIATSQELTEWTNKEADAAKAAEDAYASWVKFNEDNAGYLSDPVIRDQSQDLYDTAMALKAEADAAAEALNERKKAYEDARVLVEGYYATIEKYETGSALILEGKTTEAIEYLSQSSQAFQQSQQDFKDANRAQAEELRTNYENAKTWSQEVQKLYEEGVEGVTAEMVEEAKTAEKDAKEEWETVGVALIKGTVIGVESSYHMLESSAVGAARRAANKAIEEFERKLNSYAPEMGGGSSVGSSYDIFDRPMATGGIVRRATRALIGEAGAEAVLPLERNTGWADILADKLTERMGAGGVVVNQTNNYSQAHSQYELYKTKQDTLNAVKLAMRGAYV